MTLILQKTAPQILLYLAKKKDPVSLNDISFDMRLAYSQVSILISKFEDQELISCSYMGKCKSIQLTTKGNEVVSCIQSILEAVAA